MIGSCLEALANEVFDLVVLDLVAKTGWLTVLKQLRANENKRACFNS